MTYRVVLQRLAVEDLRDAYEWADERAPVAASRWIDRFQQSLRTLELNPQRCRLAPENGKVDVVVREYLFGKRPYIFRVIFAIDKQTVRILRIRRAQRKKLTVEELRRSLDLGE